MQKILYIVSALKRVGPINVLEGIIQELDRSRFTPIIVSLRGKDLKGNDERFRQLGAKIYHLDYSLLKLELLTISAVRQIQKIALKEGAKIVHSHGYHADLVCSYLSSKDYYKISTQHNISGEDFTYSKGEFLGRYMNHRLKNALNSFSTLVGISELVSNYVQSRQKDSLNIQTIYNGVDTEVFRPLPKDEQLLRKQSLGFQANEFIFLSVGNLRPLKDPLLTLKAFSELIDEGLLPKEVKLVMLGVGQLMDICKSLAKPYAGQILMRGFTKDVASYLQAGDCLISASHSEGFGLNVSEALATGLNVLVSDLSVHKEVLLLAGLSDEEAEQAMFPLGDKDALKRSILRMLKAGTPLHINRKALDNKRMSQSYQELYEVEA